MVFVRVFGQVVQFGFGAGVVIGFVREDELPVAVDQPAVGEVGAWLVDVDGVV